MGFQLLWRNQLQQEHYLRPVRSSTEESQL